MPFDGTDYQPRQPQWDDRLQRLADHTESLEKLNLFHWEDCAVGQAISHAVFKDELRWSCDGLPSYCQDGEVYRAWSAVGKFFGISRKHAIQLLTHRAGDFVKGRRPSPKEVARRIRAYCDMRWMAMAC